MRTRETELQLNFLFADLILLNVSLLLWAELSPYHLVKNSLDLSLYLFHANLSWLATLLISPRQSLYLRDQFRDKAFNVIRRFVWFIVVGSVVTFFLMPKSYSRLFFIRFSIVFFLVELFFYWAFYRILLYRREKGIHIKRAFIVGVTDTTKMLKTIMENNPILGYKFMGFIAETANFEISEISGQTENLAAMIQNNNVEVLFVSSSLFKSREDPNNYLKVCKWLGIRLMFVQENYLWNSESSPSYSIGEISLYNPQAVPLDDLGARTLKRIFDLFFSLMVIIFLLSWAVPLIALFIKLSSKGPVFFIQKRTGFNNKPFNCIKFRSMQVNDVAHSMQACTNDPRITQIGRFLRKTNLDEWPQFLNVFMGQMSIVGPRPHMLKHTDEYSRLIEHYKTRHYIKPGITGWAQINGFRGETDQLWKMAKRVDYDMIYLYKWNFWWDISIIFRTVFGESAYKNAQ